MTPTPVESWLHSADQDIAMAALAIDAHINSQACFHAQQAAEKALKGFLLARTGTYPKSHALEQLLLFDTRDELREWRDRCRSLDVFYLPTRYPDAWPQGAFAEPAEAEARTALDVARALLADVRTRISKP